MRIFRLLLKSLLILVVLLFLVGLGYGLLHYKADLPLEVLKEKYEFEDSKYLELDGMQVHYRQVGQGPPLVLIHGYGGNLWNWEAWTEILQDSFQVVTLDLPGFGFTGPRLDGDYSTAKYIDFLNRFFDQIGLDSFNLAGNSMGGSIAWQYALRHPEETKKLILVNAAGYPRKMEKEIPIGFKIPALPGAEQVITKVTPRSIMEKTVKGIYGNPEQVTAAGVDQFMDIMRREGNRKALFDRRKADQGLGSEAIKNIIQPTLIIWGDQDRLIPAGDAHKFGEDIQNAEVIVYENIGHVPMMEIPERSASDVRQFLMK